MDDPFQTLRFRLTLQSVVIFGLLQVLLWVTIYFVVDRHLRMRFDAELLRRAQALVVALDNAEQERPHASPGERSEEVLRGYEMEQFFIAIQSARGGPLVRSMNFRGVTLPIMKNADRSLDQPAFMTIPPEQTATWASGEPVRLVMLDRDPASNEDRVVWVGASLGPVERVVLDIQRFLVIFIVLSLMLAGISGWAVAGRSLRPIGVITREARKLSASTLHQRITKPRHTDEVSAMVDAINQMLGRLERQFRNEHDFISSASHELKTPLAIMLGHVQNILRRTDLTPEVRDFLNSSEEELWRMLKIVESCLVLSRARSAERLTMTTPVMIEDAVLTSVKGASDEARKKGVKIVPRINLGDGALRDPVILGDSDLLVTMFENLLNNAIRYTPSGGEVEVEVQSSTKEAQISVRDHGPGIPVEHLERIFEFCYQVDPGGPQSGKSGIGLTIVNAVAELHGGTVTAVNREGGGCEFTVRLPLSAVETRA